MVDMDPAAAQALALTARFQSALDGQLHRMNAGTFKASDEAESVEVTLNGYQWLTGMRIQDGLLNELGAQGVEQRINEALLNAQRAATAFSEQTGEALVETLNAISQAINRGPS
jgi:DNA-binding protein YbaB